VQADEVPATRGAKLDEVAELVRHPEPAPVRLIRIGSAATGEWVVDPATVLDLAH
jgi:hypothetical protein